MKNILNIQGDDPTMHMMTTILERAGYRVVNARQASAKPAHIVPDLIVINTNMPVPEKRACVQALRMLVPGVRIVDLAVEASELAHNTGADAYLDKPFTSQALLDQVKLALDGHARYAEEVPPAAGA